MPTSIDAQIRSRARNLAIDKCYVNEGWDTMQLASVVVTRKHVNGNVTFGFYLVDLLLLGVKDCFYGFNTPRIEFEENILKEIKMTDVFIECDYDLAHNIIYEGITFAEDFGFEPHRDFNKAGVYILQEDSEEIPQMDIPLGEDGVPTVIIDSENNRQREISILERTAGPGNFNIYDESDDDDDFDDDYDDDDYDDDDDTWNYESVLDEMLETGFDEYLAKYKDDMTPVQLMAITDILYTNAFHGDKDPDSEEETEFDSLYNEIMADERVDTALERLPELDKHVARLQEIIDETEDDDEALLERVKALVDEYPDEPELNLLLVNQFWEMKMMDDAERLLLYWRERAPEHYAVRLFYAKYLVEKNRFDEMLELFGNIRGLDAITKENLPITEVMVVEFCACYALAWLSKDDIEKADPYYKMMHIMDRMTPIVDKALFKMTEKKSLAIEEFSNK